MTHDAVNHPKHYTSHPSGIECIDVTRHMGFNLGNAVKYVWRADLKGDAIEDLRKAAWYIADEIKRRERARDQAPIAQAIEQRLDGDDVLTIDEHELVKRLMAEPPGKCVALPQCVRHDKIMKHLRAQFFAVRAGITLIEALVIVTIVSGLLAIVLPNLSHGDQLAGPKAPPAAVRAAFDAPTTAPVPGQEFRIQPAGRAAIGTCTVNSFSDKDRGWPADRAVITVTDPFTGRRWLGVEGFGLVEIGPERASAAPAGQAVEIERPIP